VPAGALWFSVFLVFVAFLQLGTSKISSFIAFLFYFCKKICLAFIFFLLWFCFEVLSLFGFLQMWPDLIQKAKEGGLDVIQTYVFWNGHEPSPGQVMDNGSYFLFFWHFNFLYGIVYFDYFY
jgi:hypothetical protein